MTLFYVIGSLDIGGAEHHLAQITPRLVALGWEVVVCCLSHRGEQADSLAGEGVNVIAPPFEVIRRWRHPLLRPIRLALATFGLILHMLKHRPRIAHFFLPGAYLIGGPVAILTGVPIRIMSRRSRNHYQLGRPLAARLEFLLHRRMAAVIGNSRRVVADLAGEGCPREKVGLIYNGVELARFHRPSDRAAARHALGIGEQEFVAVTVANLIAYKGHLDLIEALAGVRDRLPGRWVLLCVGRDDGWQSEIERRAQKRGIAGHVRFLGSRRDVPELLGLADLGILASHEEGFSNAVIEMMAAGLASVVTDVGGNGEAVRDGVSGFVVPPKSPGELGRAIARLACEPSLRNRMGHAARLRVKEHFGLEACVRSYVQLYEALLVGKPIGQSVQLTPTNKPNPDGGASLPERSVD